MSRPTLLPPLAPETVAALERIDGGHGMTLAPRHQVKAEAHPRLLAVIQRVSRSERHLREMDAAAKAGTVDSSGTPEGRPIQGAAKWAKRCIDDLTEISRVASEVGDEAFAMHVQAIQRGLGNPQLPLRWQVWMAWRLASMSCRPPMTDDEFSELIENGSINREQYTPTAGEVASFVGSTKNAVEISVRDCVNHLKALGLPYAPARRGVRKSI